MMKYQWNTNEIHIIFFLSPLKTKAQTTSTLQALSFFSLKSSVRIKANISPRNKIKQKKSERSLMKRFRKTNPRTFYC